MSTQKTTLKNIFLIGIFLFISTVTFAQKSQPDTLVINTVKGKMILISDSLAYFKNANTMVLINKALEQVKDSLPKTDSLKKKERLPKDLLYSKVLENKKIIALSFDLGSSVVFGKINPNWGLGIDFAPQRQDFYSKGLPRPTYSFINLGISNITFFEKANQASKTQIFNNLFIEASIGNRINNKNAKGLRLLNEASIGAGYLISEKGNYFDRDNRFKLFCTIVPNGWFIGFKPEMYLTGNYKTNYMGLTLKLIILSMQFNP